MLKAKNTLTLQNTKSIFYIFFMIYKYHVSAYMRARIYTHISSSSISESKRDYDIDIQLFTTAFTTTNISTSREPDIKDVKEAKFISTPY